jgi:protoheme IX farnesyltransferase
VTISVKSAAAQAETTRTVSSVLQDYLALTKPRIVALLLFTTLTAMVIAAERKPIGLVTLAATMIGGALAAAGSGAINQYIDRDLDLKMKRTCNRPIPSGRIAPINGLLFGLALVAWSAFILGALVNWLTAGLALAGALYYVVVYTVLLKRNTVLNILIGGGAGAMPVLVGWSAVTGRVEFPALLLFAIVFYWTPPHSWALALLVNNDYAQANVPMMPVARGAAVTTLQIVLYSLQLALLTLLPSVFRVLGGFYLALAVVLNIGLLYYGLKLNRHGSKAAARQMYKYSTMYLALLFLAMIVDASLF